MKWLLLVLGFCILPMVVAAEENAAEQPPAQSEKKLVEIHGELKAHYRWSEDSRFPVKFPFTPDQIPAGQTAVFERTVSPGSSFEVSVAALILDLNFSDSITGKVRVNFIDLYNRNPTSTDQTVDVKEAWMQFGHKWDFMQSVEGSKWYVLFGKAPKFEREPERNLESYGLVETAFNRLEDIQLQTGGNFGTHLYWRAQASAGNPLFFRDSNALAGDNGTPAEMQPHPTLALNSGFPILYDAEVEDVSTRRMELGGGIGARFQNEDQTRGLDILGFYYNRELADRADLRGTFYGGDIDLIDGVGGISLPIHGRRKEEYGGNLEFHSNKLRVWFQGVHQDVAGLKRNGYEVEVAWRAGLPLKFASSGKQLFAFIQPVFRFSMLDNDFGPVPLFPAPSTFWDWKKYDVGFRMGIISGVDVTAEYAIHDISASLPVSENEFLTTLRARF